MGDLVLLPQSKTPPRDVVAGESAAILFFTGVRYCRLDQPDVPTSPVAIKRRRSAKGKKPTVKAIVELHA